MNILHIYAHGSYHDPVYIVGDTTSLIALKEAIDTALSSIGVGIAESFVADGEGFKIHVVNNTKADWDKVMLPYVDVQNFSAEEDEIRPDQIEKMERE